MGFAIKIQRKETTNIGDMIPLLKDRLARVATIAHLEIRKLEREDFAALANLVANSSLPTLNDPLRLKRNFEENVIFGSFIEDALVGCCCIEREIRKEYLTGEGKKSFPLPNIYLCGGFVLESYRKLGIGQKLYGHRLDFAKSNYEGTIIVEVFGDGSKHSVHPESVNGYRFYQRNGFKEVGYSIDPDAGKVLFLNYS